MQKPYIAEQKPIWIHGGPSTPTGSVHSLTTRICKGWSNICWNDKRHASCLKTLLPNKNILNLRLRAEVALDNHCNRPFPPRTRISRKRIVEFELNGHNVTEKFLRYRLENASKNIFSFSFSATSQYFEENPELTNFVARNGSGHRRAEKVAGWIQCDYISFNFQDVSDEERNYKTSSICQKWIKAVCTNTPSVFDYDSRFFAKKHRKSPSLQFIRPFKNTLLWNVLERSHPTIGYLEKHNWGETNVKTMWFFKL